MSRIRTFQELFRRDRRRGDLVFALAFLALALVLLAAMPTETTWVKRTKLFAQPAFWPAVSVVAMTVFAALHLLGSFSSPRIPGRLQEALYWARSLEWAAWFLAYVWVVPLAGYLLSTLVFCPLLCLRLGYRGRTLLVASGFGLAVVVVFKSLLSVKIPAGAIYEALPPGALRTFMMVNF
ncbi:tripartite tricarboxylate transporter TctB family protein [Mesobacterium pallidum]|uniref:tripartite tricarboxylate transporter TctB family protein n=1 Tax=Mesobacterium pallidum TaxID=2872037 RepID=UPI001EE22EA5|nr:tripartite tricarboxylate transporter TctB family protein [Mesobacterium pallidum]